MLWPGALHRVDVVGQLGVGHRRRLRLHGAEVVRRLHRHGARGERGVGRIRSSLVISRTQPGPASPGADGGVGRRRRVGRTRIRSAKVMRDSRQVFGSNSYFQKPTSWPCVGSNEVVVVDVAVLGRRSSGGSATLDGRGLPVRMRCSRSCACRLDGASAYSSMPNRSEARDRRQGDQREGGPVQADAARPHHDQLAVARQGADRHERRDQDREGDDVVDELRGS